MFPPSTRPRYLRQVPAHGRTVRLRRRGPDCVCLLLWGRPRGLQDRCRVFHGVRSKGHWFSVEMNMGQRRGFIDSDVISARLRFVAEGRSAVHSIGFGSRLIFRKRRRWTSSFAPTRSTRPGNALQLSQGESWAEIGERTQRPSNSSPVWIAWLRSALAIARRTGVQANVPRCRCTNLSHLEPRPDPRIVCMCLAWHCQDCGA